MVSQATADTGASSYSISATGVVTTDTALRRGWAARRVLGHGRGHNRLRVERAQRHHLGLHDHPRHGSDRARGDGVTPAATTGAGPTDIAASPDGAFLYTRNGAGQSISSWPIAADGTLGATTTFAGTPASSSGLVVR